MFENDNMSSFDGGNSDVQSVSTEQTSEQQNTQSAQTEQNTGAEQQPSNNYSSYFETNFNPLAQNYQQPQYQFQQPAQYPQYQQYPQQQFNQQYPQNTYQQQQNQPQSQQQFTGQQQQQFNEMNTAEQQQVKQAISLGIDNETALSFIDKEDYAGFSNLIAEKIIANLPQQQPQNVQQIVNQQLSQLIQQEQIAQLDNRITQKVTQSLAKEGLNLSQSQLAHVRNIVLPNTDRAYIEYQGRYAEGLTRGDLSKVPHNNGRLLSEEDFLVEYSKFIASQEFGNRQKSNVPNQVIRQNVNPIHSSGSPVAIQGNLSKEQIMSMSADDWEKYKAENLK